MYKPLDPPFPAPDLTLNILATIFCALVIVAQGPTSALTLVA